MAKLITCPCGARFEAVNGNARYCSATCRKRGSRAGLRLAKPATIAVLPEPSVEVGSVVAATIADLQESSALDTPAGLAAVKLAQLIDGATLMQGSSVAAWVREMRAAIAEAKQAPPVEERNPLAEMKRRRDARLNA